MKTKYTVSIGIPAFNEEKTIAQLLRSIFTQRGNHFVLEKVYVGIDGSVDNTEKIVKKIHNTHLKILKSSKREGKATRLNEFFKTSVSDILIIFDADIIIDDQYLIDKLTVQFNDKKIGLVSADNQPVCPATFLGKTWYASEKLWYEIRKNVNEGDSVYNNSGCSVAFRREFARSINLPKETIADQQFIYIYSVIKKWKFYFARNANIYYLPPSTWKDILTQFTRSLGEDNFFRKNFGTKWDEYFKIPKKNKFFGTIRSFIKDPFYTLAAILLLFFLNSFVVVPNSQSTYGFWDSIESSKLINELKYEK